MNEEQFFYDDEYLNLTSTKKQELSEDEENKFFDDIERARDVNSYNNGWY